MNILVKRGSLDNVITYEHYCDAKADLANIPKNQITLGSTAVVLQDEDGGLGIYIASSDKEWVAVSTSSGGGSSGGTSLDFIHICASGEYNNQTLVPIIEFPEENVFYLVPNGGSNSDLFDEWIWTNNNWEKFGIGKVGPQGEPGNDYVLTIQDKTDIAGIVLSELPTATGVNF